MRTNEVVWWGEPGIELSSDDMAVVVLPRRGAKIASLHHRPSRREWLEQPDGELGGPPEYGSSFTQAALFGWDEMVPTIISCPYPEGAHRGTQLPDHGEVWSLPWETGAGAEALVSQVAGRALPYRLTRTMRLDGSRMTLDYLLATSGSTPLWLLWAAHPQFAVEDGTRVVLPPEVGELVDVTAGSKQAILPWPSPELESPLLLRAGTGRKLYLSPDLRVGTAGLIDGDGAWMSLAWNPAQVPYLGIWLDNGAYARHPIIALEPTTGYYDDLAAAVSNQRLRAIDPRHPLAWSLEVRLGKGRLP